MLNRPVERIPTIRGPQDGSAEVGDAADRAAVEADDSVVLEEAVITVIDAHDFPAELLSGEHDGSDDGIEAGGVSATGVYGDASDVRHGRVREARRIGCSRKEEERPTRWMERPF